MRSETEQAIDHYRAIETERELTDREERRMVSLLKCAKEDREEEEQTHRRRRTGPRITHTPTPFSSWISGLTYVRPADPFSPSPALSSAFLVVWTKDPHTGAPKSALLYMIPPAVACKLPGLLKAGRVGDITGSGPSTGRAYWRLVRGQYPEKTIDRDAMKAILRSWK